jgi:hypothetical protein
MLGKKKTTCKYNKKRKLGQAWWLPTSLRREKSGGRRLQASLGKKLETLFQSVRLV